MDNIVFQAEVSPVKFNATLGPIRSYLYGFVIASKMKVDGLNVTYIMKCDDSNPEKHRKEDFYDIYTLFTSLGIQADIHPYNSERILGCSLFQSERGRVYQQYLEKLCESEIAFSEENSEFVVLDIEKFATNHVSVIEVKDELLGNIVFNIDNILKGGKKVLPLRRSNGRYLFDFASVVDSQELGVSYIVRGQDRIPASFTQEILRIAFGFSSPKYIHLPLLFDEKGKRTGGYIPITNLLEAGIVKEALISYVLSSGYGNPDEIFLSLQEFVSQFCLQKLHRNNTKFCGKKLTRINERVMRLLPPHRYQQSIQSYIDQSCGKGEADMIKHDEDIKLLLGELRLSPTESVNLVNAVMFPRTTLPDNALTECISLIKKRLRTGTSYDALCADLGYFDREIFFRSLSWILTRETIKGVGLKRVFLFLQKKGLLLTRATEAV